MNQTATPDVIKPLGSGLDLHFSRDWLSDLGQRMDNNGPWDQAELFQLALESEAARLVHSFDELQCLRHLPDLQPLEHQMEAARKVLLTMRGRAILADEVGLGKTIEAGLVLKEYMVRGLVKKVLILVPASLVLQWVRELNQKFGIAASAQRKAYMWEGTDVIVASIDTAKRPPHREIVMDIDYDMLIIDEAHKLKNKKTTNYQFVGGLKRKYCLLLTATPVQNDMDELYNLIHVLKPGQLGGEGSFQDKFVAEKRVPKNEGILQSELAKIMIRNRRSDGRVDFTRRVVKNIPLVLSPEEQALYDGVTRFVKERYDEMGRSSSAFTLVTLQREVCSSRDAVFVTLVHLFKKLAEESPMRPKVWELVELIKGITANSKAEKVLELIQGINDKVIVFTEYRASQEYLLKFLKDHGISAVPYRGGMNRGKKDWMMDLFRGRAQVLVATEAGGEGINLQFCHNMINFDLPWNPMRLEQRIGRIHRLGQQFDVNIYNLSTIGTIEEHILHLLHEKIHMFELVIGGLDHILEQKAALEADLMKLVLAADNESEMRAGLERLGDNLLSAVETTINPGAAPIPEGIRHSKPSRTRSRNSAATNASAGSVASVAPPRNSRQDASAPSSHHPHGHGKGQPTRQAARGLASTAFLPQTGIVAAVDKDSACIVATGVTASDPPVTGFAATDTPDSGTTTAGSAADAKTDAYAPENTTSSASTGE